MRAVKFCSECGEQLKVRRAPILPFRSFCHGCAPRFLSARLLLIAALALFAAGGYAIGRYTTPRRPFYLIGTPIDLNANRARTSANQNSAQSSDAGGKQATGADTAEGVCGARTKSGRPCRRKVVGGGYCWQHRDKAGPKKTAARVQ
ncbi:MAG TPA: hypothetical protein VF762_17265 [Blastocatellia bacterium]|jgi:hypothetical protein